jgi:hypothetical protein
MTTGVERRALTAIAVSTIASGAAQAVAPGVVLRALAAQDDATTRHLFATVGMFMVCMGGASYAALQEGGPRGALRWSAAQKLAASAAVGLGVRRGVFARRALAVASFDLLSGLLTIDYLGRAER